MKKIILGLIVALAGCGQKGNLYLPTPTTLTTSLPATHASAPTQ